PEQRNSGLVVAGIVLAGLVAVSIDGNGTYFGVIRVGAIDTSLLWPGLLTALASGVAGGLFARVVIASLSGKSGDVFTRWRNARPVAFAAGCGLALAVIGVVNHGATFGSGYVYTRTMLEGQAMAPPEYVLFKFIATWITTWSGAPAGIFAPSLSIGAAVGNDIALLTHYSPVVLMALGMAGFLAAATQAPLTAFIIVMEMVDGHAMVLSLMASAYIASGVARILSKPLYPSLALQYLARMPPPEVAAVPAPAPVPVPPPAAAESIPPPIMPPDISPPRA
ncbi:MAG: chloride channel protein, partial [Burkholderiales bacterium]|nr:chloride channel protein [Burkholderiales bacterium]